MEKIRIIGVPEHFNYPWRKMVEDQPFMKEELLLEWRDEPKGSGAMNRAIRENETDIAIILTESFIKYKVEGNAGKIIGFHVRSPLVWGIHVPAKSGLEEVGQLANIPFLVSRMGSGSHLMSFLLAKREGWDLGLLDFEVVGDLNGAVQAFKKSTPKAFLWEKFTTKPLVDQGLFRRVGEIPTPWPCFVIVASEKAMAEYPEQVLSVRDKLYHYNSQLMGEGREGISAVSKFYGLDLSDVEQWFSQTTWAIDPAISKRDLAETMEILLELGLIKGRVGVEELV